jgi:hypothetical protein
MQLSASLADFAARRGRCVVATVSAEDNDVGGEGTKTARLKCNRNLEAVVGKSGGGIRRACQVVGYDAVTELLVLSFHAPGFGTLATKYSANSFAMPLGTRIRSLRMQTWPQIIFRENTAVFVAESRGTRREPEHRLARGCGWP